MTLNSITNPAILEHPEPLPGWIQVVLDVPLDRVFDYRCSFTSHVGQRVLVPFGRSRKVGVVIALATEPPTDIAAEKIREAIAPLDAQDDIPALPPDWLAFAQFAAGYYHRPLGEIVLPALPALLRKPATHLGATTVKPNDNTPLKRIRKALNKTLSNRATQSQNPPLLPQLNAQQQAAVDAICPSDKNTDYAVHVLFGVTGSGKTEVYMRCVQRWLARGAQVLILVPEINLTPQLAQRVRERFADKVVVTLNSSMAETERAVSWLAAAQGQADIVLGTRLSIFTPMPRLGAIVVDEEHDPSFKQQEGLRYSARDLAVWRGQQRQIPVVLGSATPSIETWHQVQQGRYQKSELSERADPLAQLPVLHLIDTRQHRTQDGVSKPLADAITRCLERREQALIFINRRGYAPVLTCGQCGWVSQCKQCSAFMVFHRAVSAHQSRSLLQCHHCGAAQKAPPACPDCGNQDIDMIGRGTQRLQEGLQTLFGDARIERMDADSTRNKGSAQAVLERMHAGEIDILVGTQMVAKGHDFKRLTLVGVINSDAALVSHDFRATERMFATLLQVSGRAGRAQLPGQVLIQTQYPEHPLYRRLLAQDVRGFLNQTLASRQETGLPPAGFIALLRAQASQLAQAQAFLQSARELATSVLEEAQGIQIYAPVPLRMMRKAGTERAQLLIESSQRMPLQHFLRRWLPQLPAMARHGVTWHIEVDPQEI